MSTLLTNNFLVRTLSGAVMLVVVMGSIFLSPFTMAALMAAICIGSMLEFYKLGRLTGAQPLDTYPVILGVLAIITAFYAKINYVPWTLLLALIPGVFAIFIAELWRRKETPFANIAWSVTGLVYIALPMALMAMLPVNASATSGYIVYHPLMILSVLFIVWANDIGAYIFGVLLGRHKLLERLSPKKTWEGFFGGLLCAVGVGVLMSMWQETSAVMWTGAAIVTALASVAGDLIESMLKRSAGVKDSGSIIPGHGGFMDRFDAFIVAAPFVFTYFIIYFTL